MATINTSYQRALLAALRSMGRPEINEVDDGIHLAGSSEPQVLSSVPELKTGFVQIKEYRPSK